MSRAEGEGVSTEGETRSTVLKAGASREDSGRVIQSTSGACLVFGLHAVPGLIKTEILPLILSGQQHQEGDARALFNKKLGKPTNLISSRLCKSLHYPSDRANGMENLALTNTIFSVLAQ